MSSVYTCFEWREHVLEEESVERRKGEEREEGEGEHFNLVTAVD